MTSPRCGDAGSLLLPKARRLLGASVVRDVLRRMMRFRITARRQLIRIQLPICTVQARTLETMEEVAEALFGPPKQVVRAEMSWAASPFDAQRVECGARADASGKAPGRLQPVKLRIRPDPENWGSCCGPAGYQARPPAGWPAPETLMQHQRAAVSCASVWCRIARSCG
jgi:hypothetical protein